MVEAPRQVFSHVFKHAPPEALISVYASARQVEAELAHKVVWKLMRRTVKKMFPDDESMRLPSRPMRRHHYLYGRNRYLSNPAVLEGLAKLHREIPQASLNRGSSSQFGSANPPTAARPPRGALGLSICRWSP